MPPSRAALAPTAATSASDGHRIEPQELGGALAEVLLRSRLVLGNIAGSAQLIRAFIARVTNQ